MAGGGVSRAAAAQGAAPGWRCPACCPCPGPCPALGLEMAGAEQSPPPAPGSAGLGWAAVGQGGLVARRGEEPAGGGS